MYYEVYIDSLFLLEFIMNLYLLLLTNQSLYRTATRFQILIGASFQGICSLILVVPLRIGVVIKGSVVLLGTFGTLIYVFKPRTVYAAFKVIGKYMQYLCLMGGAIYLLMNHVKVFYENVLQIGVILGLGGLLWIIILKREEKEECAFCRVIIHAAGEKHQIVAIVDSGNTLTEPISGKPVSVMDREVFEKIYINKPTVYRAIPYRSVGCEHGIMEGYEVSEIVIERGGIRKRCRNIFIGISSTPVSASGAYHMLVHPVIMGELKGVKRRMKNGA